MSLTLGVYESDATTLVGSITQGQYGRAHFLDVGSQPGASRGVLLRRILDNGAENPALALIAEDRIIRFMVDGLAVWQMLVEPTEDVELSPESEPGEYRLVAGRGTMAAFDKVRWLPDRGLGRQPFHPDRPLGFAANRVRDDDPDGPQGAWPPGVNQPPQYDGTPVYFGRPEGYVDTAGQWVAGVDTRTDFAPGGRWYWRERFTAAADHDAVLWQYACDDRGELWVNNVATCRVEGVYQGGCVQAVTPLSAGDVLVAGLVDNANELRTGFVASCWSLVDGKPDELLWRASASACRVLWFPDRPPGFTPTELIRLGIDEANDRGMLPDVDALCSYISASDTYHQPLQEVTDLAVKAPADSLLTTLGMLGETYLDHWMSPVGLEHNAVVRGTRGDRSRTMTGGTGAEMTGGEMVGWGDVDLADNELTVVFGKGTCRMVTRTSDPSERYTVALVTASGQTAEVTHPDAAGGRFEAALDFGDSVSLATAKHWARLWLEVAADARRGITIELVPEVGPQPYVDFGIGDSVLVLGERHRVAAIGLEVNADGLLRWTVDLDQPRMLLEERLNAIMRRFLPGGAGGRTMLPSPSQPSFPAQQEGRETTETWSSPESGAVVLRKNGTAIPGAVLAADGGVTLLDDDDPPARKCAAGDTVDITIGGTAGFTPFPVPHTTWLQHMAVSSNAQGTTVVVRYV